MTSLIVNAPEPIAWESTTVCFTKYITQSRYEKFSDKVRAWYKPYVCSRCSATEALVVGTSAVTRFKVAFQEASSTCGYDEAVRLGLEAALNVDNP